MTTFKKEDGGSVGFDTRTGSDHIAVQTVTTTMEYHVDRYDKYGGLLKGFFKAPETGRYRFHLSSDDGSKFWLDEAERSYPEEDGGPRVFSDSETKADRSYYCPVRRFYNELPERVN